jgi:hypothetical protein
VSTLTCSRHLPVRPRSRLRLYPGRPGPPHPRTSRARSLFCAGAALHARAVTLAADEPPESTLPLALHTLFDDDGPERPDPAQREREYGKLRDVAQALRQLCLYSRMASSITHGGACPFSPRWRRADQLVQEAPRGLRAHPAPRFTPRSAHRPRALRAGAPLSPRRATCHPCRPLASARTPRVALAGRTGKERPRALRDPAVEAVGAWRLVTPWRTPRRTPRHCGGGEDRLIQAVHALSDVGEGVPGRRQNERVRG